MKKCVKCNNIVSDSSVKCPKCENNEFLKMGGNKKKKTPIWLIVLILLIGLSILSSAFGNAEKAENNKVNEDNKTNTTEKVDRSSVIHEDGNFLVKITDYDRETITDSIKLKVYIENNSDKDTSFTIKGDVSIDGFMVEGGYFYEEVKAHTKANKEINMYSLKKSGVDKKTAKEVKFNFDIYQSENYMITNRIIENKPIIYLFK